MCASGEGSATSHCVSVFPRVLYLRGVGDAKLVVNHSTREVHSYTYKLEKARKPTAVSSTSLLESLSRCLPLKYLVFVGLGTSTAAEAKEYFAAIDKHQIDFAMDEPGETGHDASE